MEFAYVHHKADHMEIVNITKHPIDYREYMELEVRRKESPNIVIYCKKDCVEEVLREYRQEINHD
jgi:hypothetical protein